MNKKDARHYAIGFIINTMENQWFGDLYSHFSMVLEKERGDGINDIAKCVMALDKELDILRRKIGYKPISKKEDIEEYKESLKKIIEERFRYEKEGINGIE